MDLELLATVIDAMVHQKHDGTMLVGDDAVRWTTGGGLSHVTIETATFDRWGFDVSGMHALEKATSSLLAEAPLRGRGARSLQLRGALAKLIIERFRNRRKENGMPPRGRSSELSSTTGGLERRGLADT